MSGRKWHIAKFPTIPIIRYSSWIRYCFRGIFTI